MEQKQEVRKVYTQTAVLSVLRTMMEAYVVDNRPGVNFDDKVNMPRITNLIDMGKVPPVTVTIGQALMYISTALASNADFVEFPEGL